MTNDDVVRLVQNTIYKANEHQSESFQKFIKEHYKSKLECKESQTELKKPIYARIEQNSKTIGKAAMLLVSTNLFTGAIVFGITKLIFS